MIPQSHACCSTTRQLPTTFACLSGLLSARLPPPSLTPPTPHSSFLIPHYPGNPPPPPHPKPRSIIAHLAVLLVLLTHFVAELVVAQHVEILRSGDGEYLLVRWVACVPVRRVGRTCKCL